MAERRGIRQNPQQLRVKAVSERHPGIRELLKDEIYNRYVEVLPERR
jgi:hypothetical protein